MAELIRRWLIFCKERFPLARHILLIVFYVAANALVALYAVSLKPVFTYRELLCAPAVLAIFFHLRVFDEIKDYKNDLGAHKDRPLPRGLITAGQARRMACLLIIIELSLAYFIGPAAFIAAICTAGYSLIMYKEFFIGKWLRPKMATYALAHTLVSCWMSLFIFSSVTGLMFWKAPPVYGMFVLVNWMIFNIFEFGRKTFGKQEESRLVESYSRRLGPVRAAFNVVIMATVAMFAANKLANTFNLGFVYQILMLGLYGLTLIASGLYSAHNDKTTGRFFRGVCSLFILAYNVLVVFGFYIWKS